MDKSVFQMRYEQIMQIPDKVAREEALAELFTNYETQRALEQGNMKSAQGDINQGFDQLNQGVSPTAPGNPYSVSMGPNPLQQLAGAMTMRRGTQARKEAQERMEQLAQRENSGMQNMGRAAFGIQGNNFPENPESPAVGQPRALEDLPQHIRNYLMMRR